MVRHCAKDGTPTLMLPYFPAHEETNRGFPSISPPCCRSFPSSGLAKNAILICHRRSPEGGDSRIFTLEHHEAIIKYGVFADIHSLQDTPAMSDMISMRTGFTSGRIVTDSAAHTGMPWLKLGKPVSTLMILHIKFISLPQSRHHSHHSHGSVQL